MEEVAVEEAADLGEENRQEEEVGEAVVVEGVHGLLAQLEAGVEDSKSSITNYF